MPESTPPKKIKPLVSNYQYDSRHACNTTPIFFLSPIEPTKISVEQMDTSKTVSKTSETDNDFPSQTNKLSESSASTPPPSKKKYDIMKDPTFLTSPVFPPQKSPKDSFLTHRDHYLRPILSNKTFTFKSEHL